MYAFFLILKNPFWLINLDECFGDKLKKKPSNSWHAETFHLCFTPVIRLGLIIYLWICHSHVLFLTPAALITNTSAKRGPDPDFMPPAWWRHDTSVSRLCCCEVKRHLNNLSRPFPIAPSLLVNAKLYRKPGARGFHAVSNSFYSSLAQHSESVLYVVEQRPWRRIKHGKSKGQKHSFFSYGQTTQPFNPTFTLCSI